MTFRTLAPIAALALISVLQTSAQQGLAPVPLVPTKDPGAARASLIIDPRNGVDVLRLEIQPGAARTVHQHDDVRFHLFLPISGSIEVTRGAEKLAASPGQAYFFRTGVPHGYRNTGSTLASGFEVFIRDPKPTAAKDDGKTEQDALALALALTAAHRN